MNTNDLPDPEYYYLYVFNHDGYHNGKVKVMPDNLDNTFATTVKLAKTQGLKVIMTDEYDNCMFHMEHGEVLFPK
jgi:hypothetical protein